jgi:hypothetical protein
VIHGFWLRRNKFRTLDVPGATELMATMANNNNDKGAITENYIDKNNPSHGFQWTP